ncbi:MAG: pyridoxal phosphate-dependent aminotransferase [Pseudomonadota bacterium]
MSPRLTDLVRALPSTVPFVGPETQERMRGMPFSARLGANESVFGPSPRAIAAIHMAAKDCWMYGDPEIHDLREALAAHHGVSRENIVVGEGIDGLLGTLVRLMVAPGDPVVTSNGAYPTFAYHVAGFGGALVKVPYRNDQEDAPALLAKASANRAKLIYLANPDNPMGTWWSAQDMADTIASVPDGSLLALDEAYIDLAPEGTAPPIDREDPRVLRFRTFSKAHGLAGLRVGYAIGHRDLIAAFDRIRNHFGVGRLSQAAALAALEDTDHLSTVRRSVARSRDQIADIARDNGLLPIPSAANFVAIDCGGDGNFGRAVLHNLVTQGIFVRAPFVAPEDRAIRISCGDRQDLDAFAVALPIALTAARESTTL